MRSSVVLTGAALQVHGGGGKIAIMHIIENVDMEYKMVLEGNPRSSETSRSVFADSSHQ